jgi:hypothetical protein
VQPRLFKGACWVIEPRQPAGALGALPKAAHEAVRQRWTAQGRLLVLQ